MFNIEVDTEIKLSLLETRHAPRLAELVEENRAYLREWLPWLDSSNGEEDSRAFIRQSLEQFAKGNGFQAGIWYKGQLVGMIGYHYLDSTNRDTEIGYWLGQTFQHQGIMGRACRFMTNYAFEELGCNRVEIQAATGNYPSRAIPEKLGYTQDGVHRQTAWLYDHFIDLVSYSMLASEWAALSAVAGG